MSQGQVAQPEPNSGAEGWPTLKAEMRLEEFMARFEEPSGANPSDAAQLAALGKLREGSAEDIRNAVWEMKAEQISQQSTLNDLQKQIDLQRLATAELIGRSQSSSAALEKFEEVAQSTAAAAEQLEAEIVLVRSCCDSTVEAASKEMAAFRAELEESRSKHYADIAELCAGFSTQAPPRSQQTVYSPQAPDGKNMNELLSTMENRDRTLRDQMTQALETAQAALSKNFLEEHRKLLVEVLEEREMRVHEVQQLRTRLESVLNAVQKGTMDGKSLISGEDTAGVTSQLHSMREAIRELRANMDEELRGTAPRGQNVTVRTLQGADGAEAAESDAKFADRVLDELGTVRKDVASCLGAANAAVRLGEHLTNELNIEVEARCSDVKALRTWVKELFEAGVAMEGVEDERAAIATAYVGIGSGLLPGPPMVIDDSMGLSQDKFRFGIPSASPYVGQRELPSSVHLALRKRGEVQDGAAMDQKLGQSMAALPYATLPASRSSQHTLVTSSQTGTVVPPGSDLSGLATPGLMLSGGSPLTLRQHTMPAGDRYLANQRRAAQIIPGTVGSNGQNMNSSVMSPRQGRMQSPIRNYHVGQPLGQPTQVSDQQLRRQQNSSPVRDNYRDGLAQLYDQQAALQQLTSVGLGAPCSASVAPGLGFDTSRRMSSNVKLARSASPVQRRTTGA